MNEGETALSAKALSAADPDKQIEAMRAWWYQHYQDPVDCCPHDSGEGGYQYIWGGPFDPKQELDAEFSEFIPEDVIDQLAQELYDLSFQWSGQPECRMDEYEFAAIAETSKPQGNFEASMIATERLLTVRTEERETPVLRRLLYVHVIFAVETYLSTVMIP